MAGKHLNGAVRPQEIRIVAQIARQLVPLSLVVLFFWIVKDHIPSLDGREILAALEQVSAWQWIVACMATGVSFWAIGRYDSVIHGVLDTGISERCARQSGVTGIAIAQFTGFGVLTGALVRWRLLPELTLVRAFQVSLTVSISFLAGWSIIAATAVLLAGFEQQVFVILAQAILWLALGIISILVWRPKFADRLPTLMCLKSVISLVLIDTVFAALALFVLLPLGTEIHPIVFFASFLVALGAGLIGGTPGGVGPFEMCLLVLLPQLPDSSLLASALAFRIIYYVLPALMAAVILLVGLRPERGETSSRLGKPSPSPFLSPMAEKQLWSAPKAEVNLIRQGEFSALLKDNKPVAIAAPAGQSLVMLGDPVDITSNASDTLKCLSAVASRMQRQTLIYKCSARTVLAGRRAGWRAIAISKEAWIRPKAHSTLGPGRRQLRRYLRKAENSSVRIVEAGRELPLQHMAELSGRWCKNQGGEKQFSMGRFAGDYMKCQRVFLAYVGEDLVAFASFHETRNEWALDLMRHDGDTPAGAMHMLIHSAIQSAAASKCNRLSLAAVPYQNAGSSKFGNIYQIARNRHRTEGLTRFKSSFQPNWTTLYALAPSHGSLLLGLWSTYRKINKTS